MMCRLCSLSRLPRRGAEVSSQACCHTRGSTLLPGSFVTCERHIRHAPLKHPSLESLRVSEERALLARASQRVLFLRGEEPTGPGEPTPKYRRQSLHTSDRCRRDHLIPWNKSFDPDSRVYVAGRGLEIHRQHETLPNQADEVGTLEAIRAPFQREDGHAVFGEVLFLWWQ
jgi:hypothetical protein